MKRMSTWLALSLFLPGLCQAYPCGSYYNDYVVRYSPYALSYNSSGLIPGGVTYSPHALAPGQSGLIYEGVRYTPYAFNYHNPGLVVDYYASPLPVSRTQVVVVSCPQPGKTNQSTRPTVHTTVTRSFGRAHESQRDNGADPMQTIRQYLAGRGFKSVDMNYLWRLEGKVVSVSFVLRDKGIAIRYSDPDVIESLAATARNNSGRQLERAWETFARDFRTSGGSVYSISASGREQIVAALDACGALRLQDNTATETVMFARK